MKRMQVIIGIIILILPYQLMGQSQDRKLTFRNTFDFKSQMTNEIEYETNMERSSDAYPVNDQLTKKPNVVIILSDDQGYGDFSAHGNPVLKTPNLDKLRGESIRFSDFHVAPQCAPTRGQLMTGLDALNNKAVMVGNGRGLIRRDIATMPEVFRQNGYQTGIFGKWHLGHTYPDRPMDRGFQKAIWTKGWGLRSDIEYDNDYYQTRYQDSLTVKTSDKYCTNLWFDKAIQWMDKKVDNEETFFTYLSLNAPHGPFHAPRKDYEFYKEKVQDNKTAGFFGMIRNIDQNMSRLDRWLKKKGIKETTLVVFMNDNGTAQGEEVFNAGMRGKKQSHYDGGHRAALFLRWPNGEWGNPRTINHAAQIQDLLPTFVDLFNLKVHQNRFDGESLVPVFNENEKNDKHLKNRMLVVQYGEERKAPRKYHGSVVWKSWRLVGKDELYNLDEDPGQQNNIASAHPGVLEKMKTFYEEWWEKVDYRPEQYVPLVVGSEKENPVILNSASWAGNYVNTQWQVAQAEGGPKGGIWHIYAEEEGKYRLKLSRWPFHLKKELTAVGPETTVGDTEINKGEPLPIQFGSVSLNDQDPITVENTQKVTKITIEIDIPAGDNTLQAWFKDENRQDLCGAFYVKVEKISN